MAEDSEVAPVPAAEPARRGQQSTQGHTDSTRQAFLSFPGSALLRSPHTPHFPRILHPAVPKESRGLGGHNPDSHSDPHAAPPAAGSYLVKDKEEDALPWGVGESVGWTEEWEGLRRVNRDPSGHSVALQLPHLQSPGHATPVARAALTCHGESFTKLRTLDFVRKRGDTGSRGRAVNRGAVGQIWMQEDPSGAMRATD